MADDNKPNLDNLIAKVNDLSGKVETFSTENASLKAANKQLTDEATRRENEIKREKVAVHRAAITSRFDTAIKGKAIFARTRDLFEMNPAFKSDDAVLGITLDFVDSYIKDNTVQGYKAPKAGGEATDTKGGDEDGMIEGMQADEAVCFHTNQLRATNLVFSQQPWVAAQMQVLRTYPKLAEAYRSQPGVKGGN